MNSPGHRANILTAGYEQIGVGIVLGTPSDSSWGATYTTDFGVVARTTTGAAHRQAQRQDGQGGQGEGRQGGTRAAPPRCGREGPRRVKARGAARSSALAAAPAPPPHARSSR